MAVNNEAFIMKSRMNIYFQSFSRFVIFLCIAVQAVYAHDHHTSTNVIFIERPDLIDFNRAGGEGLGGIAWLDFDADGDLDLFLTNGPDHDDGLFRNNGDGSFTNVAIQAGLSNKKGSSGVVVGDIDNDGYPDLFVSGEGFLIGPRQTPAKLYHNNGDGTFTDITDLSGVTGAASALSAAMGDINNDGYLDIFVTSPGHIPFITGAGTEQSHENKLYLNNGDLTFTDISVSAGIDGLYPDPTPGSNRLVSDGACVAGFSDFDRDDLLDLIVGNCNAFPLQPSTGPVRPTPFNLFSNNGDLTFVDLATDAGLDISGFWMGLAFGDFNNDGNIDLAATSTGTLNGFPHVLMRNNGDGTFTDIADDNFALTPFGWGITTADFDNDGDLDLFKVGSLPLFGAIGPKGSPGQFLINNGKHGFSDDPDAIPVDLRFDYTTGLAHGDYNNDGFEDMVVMRHPWRIGDSVNPNGHPVFLENQGNRNHWLTIRLTGTISNRMGIGSRIEVYSAGLKPQVREVRAGSSFASSESPWPGFGLDKGLFALIRVHWPSGLSEWFLTFRVNRIVDLIEGRGWFKTYR